jgi:hypothetical protein
VWWFRSVERQQNQNRFLKQDIQINKSTKTFSLQAHTGNFSY